MGKLTAAELREGFYDLDYLVELLSIDAVSTKFVKLTDSI